MLNHRLGLHSDNFCRRNVGFFKSVWWGQFIEVFKLKYKSLLLSNLVWSHWKVELTKKWRRFYVSTRRKLALSKRSHTLIYFSPLKEWLLKTWVLTMCYHFYFTRTKSFHSIYNLTRMQIMSMSNGTSTWLQANRDSNHWETWSSGRCHSKWLTPQYWILQNTGIYLLSIQMVGFSYVIFLVR